YLYFARVADIEGYPDVGGLFRDTSEAETGHAFGHLDFLKEVGDPVTNVRNLTSPFWIGTLRHSELRCLVPVTAFQLWSGQQGAKRQHWFGVRGSPIFAFAGIFRHTDDWPCFGILSCEPNRQVGAVRPNAMPLILHREHYDRWLSDDWNKITSLVVPFPSQLMTTAATAEELAG
ncbi:MAG: hypothetical protein HC788_14700, partial [Sphingopyxis sp.]|nr:hypothetical protein [Sphingopyxis sp.]